MEAEHRIEAQLSGNDHGHCDRRFAESVGEPAVQREDRHLNSEGEQECQGNPEERACRYDTSGDVYLQFTEVECAGSGSTGKESRQAAEPTE